MLVATPIGIESTKNAIPTHVLISTAPLPLRTIPVDCLSLRRGPGVFLELAMRQSWERPSLVRTGDPDPNHTYISVGRVLSQWEGVEIQLGYVYTAAV